MTKYFVKGKNKLKLESYTPSAKYRQIVGDLADTYSNLPQVASFKAKSNITDILDTSIRLITVLLSQSVPELKDKDTNKAKISFELEEPQRLRLKLLSLLNICLSERKLRGIFSVSGHLRTYLILCAIEGKMPILSLSKLVVKQTVLVCLTLVGKLPFISKILDNFMFKSASTYLKSYLTLKQTQFNQHLGSFVSCIADSERKLRIIFDSTRLIKENSVKLEQFAVLNKISEKIKTKEQVLNGISVIFGRLLSCLGFDLEGNRVKKGKYALRRELALSSVLLEKCLFFSRTVLEKSVVFESFWEVLSTVSYLLLGSKLDLNSNKYKKLAKIVIITAKTGPGTTFLEKIIENALNSEESELQQAFNTVDNLFSFASLDTEFLAVLSLVSIETASATDSSLIAEKIKALALNSFDFTKQTAEDCISVLLSLINSSDKPELRQMMLKIPLKEVKFSNPSKILAKLSQINLENDKELKAKLNEIKAKAEENSNSTFDLLSWLANFELTTDSFNKAYLLTKLKGKHDKKQTKGLFTLIYPSILSNDPILRAAAEKALLSIFDTGAKETFLFEVEAKIKGWLEASSQKETGAVLTELLIKVLKAHKTGSESFIQMVESLVHSIFGQFFNTLPPKVLSGLLSVITHSVKYCGRKVEIDRFTRTCLNLCRADCPEEVKNSAVVLLVHIIVYCPFESYSSHAERILKQFTVLSENQGIVGVNAKRGLEAIEEYRAMFFENE